MSPDLRQAARMLSREIVLEKALSGALTWGQAAQVLGLSPRQLYRVRKRYEAAGLEGLEDGRSGRPRKKRIDPEKAAFIRALKRGKYREFSVSHFYDQVVEKHGWTASYSFTLRMLQQHGIVAKCPRRGTYRRRRPRQPMIGMRVHTDGSTHRWFGPEHPPCDLVIMLDDADGRLLAARFVPEEGTLSTMALLKEVLVTFGRFGELYHDRCTAYCLTSDAKEGPDKEQTGQVSRALRTLGIRQIWAYSPQARGRCERAFGTIQGRLCAELKDARITDIDTANVYLQDVFKPAFNRRFTVTPQEPESAFVPLTMRKDQLDLLLTAQHERVVKNDYTVSFQGNTLQLPEPKDRRVLQKQKVSVHVFPDDTIAVSHHGKVLAYFISKHPWEYWTGPGAVHLARAKPKMPTSLRYTGPHPRLDEVLTNRKTGAVVRRHDLFVDFG